MKNILILGAGQSTPYLINYLLEKAQQNDWFVTLADMDYNIASSRIGSHPSGNAIEFDVTDDQLRSTLIKNADVVINMLSPAFQYLVAIDCLHHRTHCISASYEHVRISDLHKDAMRQGILILNEMGLDPGIDHMSAMAIIESVRENGGMVESFISYGSGIPAPEVKPNPLNYCITWNPRNVVMSGESGAQYIEDGKIKILSHYQVFQRTWPVEVEGIGILEAYPNRDSLTYQRVFQLNNVKTMIRGTLRYPGWSETWLQIVRLGIPNEHMKIPNLKNMTFAEFTEMFIPLGVSGKNIERRVASFLDISPTGKIMENLRWLGLFSDEIIGQDLETAEQVMTSILINKLPLPADGRDMVALVHEIEATYGGENPRKEKIISSLIEYGEAGKYTAMSKTVGAPAAIAAELLMNGELPLTGCQIPIHPLIYKLVLKKLENLGIKFNERRF